MGQLTYFVVAFHILLDASSKFPMMSLSKTELGTYLEKPAIISPFLKFPQINSLAPPWTTALTLTHLFVPSFLSAIWLKGTHGIGQRKYPLLWAWLTCTESHSESLFLPPPVWSSLQLCGHGIYSRITALGPKALLFFLKSYRFLPTRVVNEKTSDWLYLLYFGVLLPCRGFKIRLVSVSAISIAS